VADCIKLSIEALRSGLQARGPIFAPNDDGRWVEFKGDALPELPGIRSKRPLRDLFVPPVREIVRFNKHVSQPELEAIDPDSTPGSAFGVRPCDARALSWLDKIFLLEPHVDLHYKARRDNLLLIGLACDPAESCHCGLFGFGPDEASEMDVMLHPSDGGFLAVGGSERGSQFLAGLESAAEQAAPDKREGPTPDWWKGFPEPAAMLDNFEHPVWENLQVGCMNCGACTLYCPTCQCFTIVDEPYKGEVLRRRVIDTCQQADFTCMAGGHNPRAKRHSRLRQRVMHKFKYYPERFETLACVGCGRCIRNCGVGQSLVNILSDIEAKVQAE
jgi:sulfhydrogenase subunit beta (sulfur reductase)